MPKRKYTKIETIEPQLIAMREAGKTRQEIADYFGLEKVQIKNWINRYNRRQAKQETGLPVRHRGRPRKDQSRMTMAECEFEIQRLKMENKLLRDFLWYVGRK